MNSRILFAALVVLGASCTTLSSARLLQQEDRGSFTVKPTGSLRHILASGFDSCSEILDNVYLFSRDTLNEGPEEITASVAECCKLCDEHPDCMSWTRVKIGSIYNAEGECYLFAHVPEQKECLECESGIAQAAEEPVDTDMLNPEPLDAKLEQCVVDGRSSANTAVIGACSVLTRKCPVKKVIPGPRSFSEIPTSKRPEVVERTCDILFEDACIRSAFDLAVEGDDDCASILKNGIDTAASVADCPDYDAAVDIFESILERACGG